MLAKTDALTIRNLSAAYGGKPALLSIDASIPTGSMTAIVGPNGAGKSTLIKTCLGIVPKVTGEALFFGEPLARVRGRVAYMPQRASVDWDFPATALDVVTMGLYRELGLFRLAGRRQRAKAMECLSRVGLADFASRQIGQLSGGQQQRVFLARALAQDADLYIMDEPFAGVDAATEQAIVEVLKAINAQGRTIVCVHHDLSSVARIFDRVLLLNGRTVASGPVASAFTRENLDIAYGGRLAAEDGAPLQVEAA